MKETNRALISGVAGFAGKHLCECLSVGGVEVFGTVSPGMPASRLPRCLKAQHCFDCDVRDSARVNEVLQTAQPDTLFHLAAFSSLRESFEAPQKTYEINFGGTLNFLEGLRGLKRESRFLLVSSSAVYGHNSAGTRALAEDSPLRPNNPYGASKAAAEIAARQYADGYGLDAVIVRPINHTGPGQSERFVCSDFAKQIAEIEAGIKPPVLQVGNLDPIREYCDVRDMVRAYVSAARKGQTGEVYNISSSSSFSVREIVEILKTLCKKQVTVVEEQARKRTEDVVVVRLDGSRFARQTGWKAEIPMEKTLADLLDYWRKTIGPETRTSIVSEGKI